MDLFVPIAISVVSRQSILVISGRLKHTDTER